MLSTGEIDGLVEEQWEVRAGVASSSVVPFCMELRCGMRAAGRGTTGVRTILQSYLCPGTGGAWHSWGYIDVEPLLSARPHVKPLFVWYLISAVVRY